ncbi:MAG: dTMP kinase [Chloroflexi bacterium]|jgi:dTMP kinase|nr:dTMP kinase [Chloroflexota bacterium]
MFITFEGPDGSGKSSQISALAEYLRAAGYSILQTREPGGTAIGDKIRTLLFDLKNTDITHRTEILLFQASRAQLVSQVIRPHLEAGWVVLCDRFADSTLAYQGYGYECRFGIDELRRIIDFATQGLKPDLTLLLDVDVEVGLRRRQRTGDWNRLDAFDLAFHRRVRSGYLELAREEPQRWVIVDASRPSEQVQEEIRKVVISRLQEKESRQGL